MTPFPDRTEIEQFRTLVARRLGLRYEDGKLDYLAEVARQRMELAGIASLKSYLECLNSSSRGADEYRGLSEQLTVNETFFFRNADSFRAFAGIVLPRADSSEDPGEAPSHSLGRMRLGRRAVFAGGHGA